MQLIQSNDLLARPYKAALLFTDGVFFDGELPAKAARGLQYFGVSGSGNSPMMDYY